MQGQVPAYDEALSLLKEYNESENLLKHAYSVEGVMGYMARKRGEDEEKWGVVGLLHDLDYERFSEQHCKKSQEIVDTHGQSPWNSALRVLRKAERSYYLTCFQRKKGAGAETEDGRAAFKCPLSQRLSLPHFP